MSVESWRSKRLSDLGELNRGKSKHRPRDAKHLYGGPYPFLQTGDIKSADGLVTSYSQTYSEAGLAQSRLWPRGTLAITIAANIAETAILDFDACFPDSVVGFIADKEKTSGRFVEYLFRILKRQIQYEHVGSGSVQDNINLGILNQLEFEIPPLDEQQKILSVLGSLDDKIELNRQMNETLEEMARALFRDWFIDFGPTRRQMDGATDPAAIMGHAFPNDKAAALAPLFPARLGESGLPEGWGEKPVSNYGKLKGGKQLPKTEFVYDGEFPVFGGAGHMGQTDKFNAEGYVITVGRVGAYCGKFTAHRGKAWVNNNASVFKLQLRTQREWFFLALRELDLEPIKKGAAQPFVSNRDINELILIEPGFDVREETNEVLATFLRKIEANRKENQTLTEMRDLLLPKLMSGEIQLKDSPMVQDTLDGTA